MEGATVLKEILARKEAGIGELRARRRMQGEKIGRQVEATPDALEPLRTLLAHLPHALVGEVTDEPTLRIADRDGRTIVAEPLAQLKSAWQQPLAW